jgi:hypothetical protein
MARILFEGLLREVASRRLTQTNEVDDRRTDYDANCPKGTIPFCAVIFYPRNDGFSDWRATEHREPETAIGFSTGASLYRLYNRRNGSVPSDCFRTTASGA